MALKRLLKPPESFFTQILAGFMGVLLVNLCIFLPTHRFFARRVFRDILTENGNENVSFLARASATALYTDTPSLLSETVTGLMENQAVLGIALYRKDGTLWLHREKPFHRLHPPDFRIVRTVSRYSGKRVSLVQEMDESIDFYAPVTLVRLEEMAFNISPAGGKGEVIGIARLTLSKKAYSAQQTESGIIGIGSAVAAGIFAFLFSMWLARSLSEPVHRLIEGSRRAASGRLTENITTGGTGELRELADAFNRMIAARGEFERNLEQERKRLKQILDSMPDALYIVNPDREIVYSNPAFDEMFQEPSGEKCFRHIYESEDVCPFCPMEQVLNGESLLWESEYGSSGRAVEIFSTPFTDEQGRPNMLQVMRDISRRRKTQQALEKELRLNEAMAGLARNLLTTTGDIGSVSHLFLEKACALTGSRDGYVASRDERSGAMIVQAVKSKARPCGVRTENGNMLFSVDESGKYPGLPGHCLNTKVPFFTNDPAKHPAYAGQKDMCGRLRNFLAVPVLLGNELLGQICLANRSEDYGQGELEAVARLSELYALAVDKQRQVMERERLTAELRHAQKMEAIGTLAGGIAHDFNNILAPILGYTEISIKSTPEDSIIRKHLGKILRATTRARDLVQQILAFSRAQEGDKRPIEVRPVIKEVLKLLRASIPSTIRIREDLDSRCLPILGDPVHLHQIIMNLCTNAYHAMEDSGGTLEVGAETATDGKSVCIWVSDTGPGISGRDMDRIFEPYFTTKKHGKGTGLGLAVVHGIVKGYGGDIKVESVPGQGATFRIYLPAVRAGVEGHGVALEEAEAIPRGTERILLVDDEELVLQTSEDILRSLGYRVTASRDSLAALELFRKFPHEFDLILTDQTMPEVTGTALAAEAVRVRPDIPVILCTGFSNAVDEKSAADAGISAFIMKPVTMSELARTVRRVLDRTGPARGTAVA